MLSEAFCLGSDADTGLLFSAKFSAADSASSSGDADAGLDIVTEQRLSKSTCHALVNVFLPLATVDLGA